MIYKEIHKKTRNNKIIYPPVEEVRAPFGPKYFSRRPHNTMSVQLFLGSKWPCKKSRNHFHAVQILSNLDSPKDVEKNKVDDSVDDTDEHVEHTSEDNLLHSLFVCLASRGVRD